MGASPILPFGSGRPGTLLEHSRNTPVRESKVTVKIPRPLYRRIQQVVEESGFNSPTDFIVYVLRDLMGEAEANAADTDSGPEFTQDELDDVKRKLKNLGYL
ncbi:MAG: CopG family transcriptional regulator [bacterium]|nr:CopG family transcriptional regulator [bacterium]